MTRFEFQCLQSELIQRNLKISRALNKLENVLESLPDAVLVDRKDQLRSIRQSISNLTTESLGDVLRLVERFEVDRLKSAGLK